MAISWYNFHGDQMLSSVWTIVLSQRLKIRLCFIAHYILYYFLKRSAQLDDLTRVKEHNPLKIQVPTKTCHQEFFYIRFIEYRARLEMILYSSADQIYGLNILVVFQIPLIHVNVKSLDADIRYRSINTKPIFSQL